MALNLGGLLGGFIPDSANLTEKDKQALGRQGLLALGLNLLRPSGGSFGGALANGLQGGLLAVNQGVNDIADRRYRQFQIDQGMAGPAGLREFNAMTTGLSDEDKARARRISLGLEGRASSGGYGFDKVSDARGRERPRRNNPRTGESEVYMDETGEWIPLGGGQRMSQFSAAAPVSQAIGAPAAASPTQYAGDFTSLAMDFPGVKMTSGTRTAQRNAEVGGQPNSQHLRGTAADYAVPEQLKPAFVARAKQLGYQAIDEGDHIHIQLPRGASVAGLGIGIGRPKEEEAAAVKAAERGVELGTLPDELSMRTQAALNEAQGKAQIATQAEVSAQQATKQRDANTALGLIEQAKAVLPKATGGGLGVAYDKANAWFGLGTEGANANAKLQTIAGQLTSKMPRMEGPQSDRDVEMYKQMAGDVGNPSLPVSTRMAALEQIELLNLKYAGQNIPGASSGAAKPKRLKFNPATGKIE